MISKFQNGWKTTILMFYKKVIITKEEDLFDLGYLSTWRDENYSSTKSKNNNAGTSQEGDENNAYIDQEGDGNVVNGVNFWY
jgi:hypothetical protein